MKGRWAGWYAGLLGGLLTATTAVGAEVDKGDPVATDTGKAIEKSTVPSDNPKHLPTKLAAYILHSRYLFGANGGQTWYWGKQVTVTGIVNVKEIRRIDENSLVDRKYCGQYAVPIYGSESICGDEVVCMVPDDVKLPSIIPTSVSTHKKSRHKHSNTAIQTRIVIVTFTGIVAHGERFRQVFIANAKLEKQRAPTLTRNNCPDDTAVKKKKKSKNNSDDDMNDSDLDDHDADSAPPEEVTFNDFLRQTSTLPKWGWLVLGHGMPKRIIDMGDDPQAYGAELAYLHESTPSSRIMVYVSGQTEGNSDIRHITHARIVRWRHITVSDWK